MYLPMSEANASSTAPISLRDRPVAPARLLSTSDLLVALALPGFAAVAEFAIVFHPPCEVHREIEVIWYVHPPKRIGGKLDAFSVKMQPVPGKKPWIFALFAPMRVQNAVVCGTK